MAVPSHKMQIITVCYESIWEMTLSGSFGFVDNVQAGRTNCLVCPRRVVLVEDCGAYRWGRIPPYALNDV